MSSSEKLCPFDKKPCITTQCAIWSTEYELCALALIPAGISGKKPASGAPRVKEKMSSSGISGKFKDPLFD